MCLSGSRAWHCMEGRERADISQRAIDQDIYCASCSDVGQFKCSTLNSRGSLHRFGVDFCTRDGYALVLQPSRKGVRCCLSCWRGV